MKGLFEKIPIILRHLSVRTTILAFLGSRLGNAALETIWHAPHRVHKLLRHGALPPFRQGFPAICPSAGSRPPLQTPCPVQLLRAQSGHGSTPSTSPPRSIQAAASAPTPPSLPRSCGPRCKERRRSYSRHASQRSTPHSRRSLARAPAAAPRSLCPLVDRP